MAKQSAQKEQKPQAPINLSEKIKPVGSPTPKIKRYFKKTTYIKGFGIVNAGDVLTKEMVTAWEKNTDVKIDAYVGKKDETLSELPQTDKEKLAAYEALTNK